MLKASAGSSGLTALFCAQSTGLLKPAVRTLVLMPKTGVRLEKTRNPARPQIRYLLYYYEVESVSARARGCGPNHSYRKATMGSTRVARRAGR